VTVPDWVVKANESNNAIQNLDAYSGKYCFVIMYNDDTNLKYAQAWVDNPANGGSTAAAMVSTTVDNNARAQIAGKGADNTGKKPSQSTYTDNMANIHTAMNNASYNGLNKSADFWTLSMNRATKHQYYTAYALWTIDKSLLDNQIAKNIQELVDRNKAMSAAEKAIYADIINELRSKTGSLTGKENTK
jgi:hypothetical protein